MGVDLFFTISGFVILMTVDRCKTVLDFVYGRFTRLVPTFWICMITTFIIRKVTDWTEVPTDWGDFFLSGTLLCEYWEILVKSYEMVDGVYWTLSLEVTFYAWIALLFAFNWLSYRRVSYFMFAWILLTTFEWLLCR